MCVVVVVVVVICVFYEVFIIRNCMYLVVVYIVTFEPRHVISNNVAF